MTIKILHLVHGVYENNGLESFLKSLINNLNYINDEQVLHSIAYPSSANYDDIGLNLDRTFKLDNLSQLKDIFDCYKFDILNIHWTGFDKFDRDNNNFDYLIKKGEVKILVNERTNDINLDCLEISPYNLLESSNIFDKIINSTPIITITSHSEMAIPSRFQYPAIDAVISVSDKVAKVHEHLDTNKFTIYNGVDTDLFRRKYTNYNTKVTIGYTGRFSKFDANVFNYLIDNKDKFKNYNFVFIGDYDKFDISNLPDNFHFVGKKDNIHELLNEIDIFLYPTVLDSFGLSLVEAMSFELPIITSNVVKDIIGDCGYIYQNPSDIENFINEIVSVYNGFLNVKARDRVLKNYSTRKMINSYSDVFDALIKENKKWQIQKI